MNTRIKFRTLQAIALPMMMLVSGHAVSETPKFAASLIGGKTITSLNLGLPGVSASTKDNEALGFALGYNVNETLTIEFEMVKGSTQVSATGPGGSVSTEIDIDTMALYATQRSTGDLYIKFKVGILKEEVGATGVSSEDETGLSFGIGGGYKINDNFMLEAEYVKVEDDVAWGLLSARYTFGN